MLKGDALKSKGSGCSPEIGLGKRLAAVVAREVIRCSPNSEAPAHQVKALVIRGTEDMAVQPPVAAPSPATRSCRKMKRRPRFGDSPTIAKTCAHSGTSATNGWMQWDPRIDRLFNVDIPRDGDGPAGVVAVGTAARITAADSNIAYVNMGIPIVGGDKYAVLTFTLDVRHRIHLAQGEYGAAGAGSCEDCAGEGQRGGAGEIESEAYLLAHSRKKLLYLFLHAKCLTGFCTFACITIVIVKRFGTHNDSLNT